MSRKTRGQPVDLEQIMDAGQPRLGEQMESPPVYPRKEEMDPQKAEKPNAVKSKKAASVFIYLAVLFGAAFLMLLLAFLIQQRNSENAIDDLRSSMTATREDLMAQNQQLQEDRELLEAQRAELETQLKELQKDFEQTNIELDVYMEIAGRVNVTEEENQCWVNFWGMEEEFLRGNYETCAEIFRLWYDSTYYITPESAVWRAEEIYNELVQLGYLDEDEPVRW